MSSLNNSPEEKRKTALVVDDEGQVVDVVRRMLEQAGVRVLGARSAAQAARAWSENRDSIDYILMDMILPGSEGGDVIAQRFKAAKPSVKVVFMSGYGDDTLREIGHILPPDAVFLQKPFLPLDLRRVL